ncbi:MAG: phenylalanine--tRNA ligase subunit beta [Chloroflexota bacterium]|nr:phenylalanine--tRNA ligase subunit beta [Chloroflexota bacterium]
MRVPLSWLREFVDIDLSPEALAERLTLLGMEVKGVHRIGADWSSVVVGELLDVYAHPSSPRLSLTRVRTAEGERELEIVCGATNIEAGQRVPVALPGALLPGDRSIGVTRIAGVQSEGMLCSGAELGLTPDAHGILILDSESPLGEPLGRLLGDTVLDVDVKPNRGDALSILGLAREVAAATGATVREPLIEVPESGDATDDHLSVTVQDVLRCPRFVARYLDGLTVGPSPTAVQVRLVAAGVRPVSNVVDASNYVMLELGKPVHTFDAAAVTEDRLIVRTARPGERLETLDHIERELSADTLVIADPVGPLAIAGVMGGASSEVREGTTQVIVESALFQPVTIRRTAQAYGLRSEASLRFERGQEPRMARLGADRAAQLIVRWAGGRAAMGAVDTDPVDPPATRLTFRPARIARLLGMSVSGDGMRDLLARAGIITEPAPARSSVAIIAGERPIPLDPDAAAEALVAIVPGHRRDLAIEADIAEEVARIRGYDAVPSRLPDTSMPGYRPDPRLMVDRVRDLLSGRGLNEVVTYSLVSPQDHASLGHDAQDPATIRAANPVSGEHSELRRSLLPQLMRVLVDNERQRRPDLAVFEVGAVHALVDGHPKEARHLGILLAGAADPLSWDRPSRPVDIADAKGLLEWLVERVAGARLRWEAGPLHEALYHPGRSALAIAELESGHRVELGLVSELDPRYLTACEAQAERVVFARLDLDGLGRTVPAVQRVGDLERLPALERDIAVVVAETQPAGAVEAVMRAAGGPLLASVLLFDRYEGAPLGPGEMSLAYRLRFEPGTRTLDEDGIERAVASVVDALRERLGARLRG